MTVARVRKSCLQAALDTMLYIIPLDLYAKPCAARSAIAQSRVLNVVFPYGRCVLSKKAIDYIVPEAMFLFGL